MPIRMTRDEYEQTYGTPAPPPIPEVQEAKTSSPVVAPRDRSSFFANSLKETGGDIRQMFGDMGTSVTETKQDVKGIAGDQDFNFLQKTMGVMGRVLKGTSDVIGDAVIGGGKALLSQETEDKAKEKLTQAGEYTMSKPRVQQVMGSFRDWYGGLSKEDKLIVDSYTGAGQFMVDVAGGAAVKPTFRAASQGVKLADEGLRTGARTVGEAIDTASANIKPWRIERQYEKAQEATKRIVQGKPDDVDAAFKALSEIDTDGVRNYQELNSALDDAITGYSRRVDEELSKYTDKYTPGQLGKYTDVDGQTVIEAPALDAIDGLENAYRLSGDLPNATRIAQLRSRLQNEGLTLKELNDLAREYGTEFKNLSFTKLGDPKQGFKAESYESVRRGLKETIRERMPDDATKKLDESISNFYRTKDLTEKMEIKVNNLYQKVKNRTLAQKVGGAAADVLDLVTLGTARGFVQKLLPSNVGLKTANSIDLERELSKNLAQIDKLLKLQDDTQFADEFVKYIDEVQPGLSTRVVSNLSNEQKDALLSQARNLKSNDFVTELGGSAGGTADLDAFGKVEDLIKKSDTRSLTEREYLELNALLDELQISKGQTIAPTNL